MAAKKINQTADFQKAFTEHSAQFTAQFEEVANFTKGNFEAMIASATKATESANEIANEVLAFAKTSVDSSTAAMKDLSKAKDFSELVEKQSTLSKSTMASFAQQAQKLQEMTVAAAKECAEPVNARLSVAGDIVKGSIRA